MALKKSLLALIGLTLVFSLAGCGSDAPAKSDEAGETPVEQGSEAGGENQGTEEGVVVGAAEDTVAAEGGLAALLPQEGYLAVYSGTAESGRVQKINSVEVNGDKTVYSIKGYRDDMSGTASVDQLTVEYNYLLDANSIKQELVKGGDVDLNVKNLTILKMPLEVGNQWSETVESSDGKMVEVQSSIKSIDENEGAIQYTVETKLMDSGDIETRVFEEGSGVVNYSRLYAENEFEFFFFLYKEASGYGKELPVMESDEDMVKNMLFDFNTAWVDYINTGDELVFDYVVPDGQAYKNMKSVNREGLSEEFLQVDIKNVNVDGSTATAAVHEKIRKVKDGSEKVVEYDWIYSFEKMDGSWRILGYKKDKSSASSGEMRPDTDVEDSPLKAYLPKDGYLTIYSGTGESGRVQKINSVKADGDKTVYSIKAFRDDMSGEQSVEDLTIDYKYIVDGTSIKQELVKGGDTDLNVMSLTLLKAPVKVGTTWTEPVKNFKRSTEVTASITSIGENEGTMQYTVEYKFADTGDIETRVFEEGLGMVSYTRFYAENEFEYMMYQYKDASGYGKEMPEM
ncbi:MAG: hypothetical protein N4A76_15890 [Firmicutes bacterium]|jgi:predicted small lipoprotein YifL|nr:hypothetical protein [Bacillota bacterium]